MIRAFRVGRRLARPTRLGTLSREWPACGGFGQVPAARPRSCTHDVPRRKLQPQEPGSSSRPP